MCVNQSCPTLCDPMDCSPPGSSVHGILQAKTLEWVAIPFSRDLRNPGIEPGSSALQAGSLPSVLPLIYTHVRLQKAKSLEEISQYLSNSNLCLLLNIQIPLQKLIYRNTLPNTQRCMYMNFNVALFITEKGMSNNGNCSNKFIRYIHTVHCYAIIKQISILMNTNKKSYENKLKNC